ncbi:MAG: hypothetical protein N2450_01630 [bacterium]|nr:hypothetical protein [bacterium]
MKRLLFIFSFIFSWNVFAGILEDFTVTPGNNRIHVRWESSSEVGLQRYKLERSVDGSPFVEIASIQPRGDHQIYQYIDTDIYTLDASPRTFAYRIKFQMRDGTFTYSIVRETTLNLSSIRRTWGSIKAMFR